MSSLYAKYLKERTADHIIETPRGFASYRYISEKTCYIIDIYVIPEERKQGYASKLANYIATRAKSKGCTELIGTVCPSANNADASIKTLQAYGMSVKSAQNDLIIFSKEI